MPMRLASQNSKLSTSRDAHSLFEEELQDPEVQSCLRFIKLTDVSYKRL